MAWRLESLLGRHGGDYGTKDIQVLHYGIWPWRWILNGTCFSISNLPENIAWQTHRPEARDPLKSGAWGGRPTCHPQTPPLCVCLCQTLLHILISGTIFQKTKFIENKTCVLIYSTNLSETFLILRTIQRDNIINVHRCSSKVTFILARF